jgi:hypothetical protein
LQAQLAQVLLNRTHIFPKLLPCFFFFVASQLRGRALRFQAELAQVVLSAVRYVFTPDIQFDELDFSEKVLVPILGTPSFFFIFFSSFFFTPF